MTHILHIDSSPRAERSISRQLTKEFIHVWKQIHPHDTITYRDLRHSPVPFIDESWIAASFSPPEQVTPELTAALSISDELIDELLAADLYVFGIPMYNYSIPATFKAYIGSWQLLVILVGARQKAEGRGQKEEEENYKFKL